MKFRCAFCGRVTVPAVMIGNEAVGPKCAKKAGLLTSKIPKGSSVRRLTVRPRRSEKQPYTLDLFDDQPTEEQQ